MKTKKQFRRAYNVMLASLIGLINCSSGDDDPVCEYGTPTATFKLNGKITSEVTNLPLKGIRVILKEDTAYTDNSGEYKLVDKWAAFNSKDYVLKLEDIDGTKNGTYKNKDVTIDYSSLKFKGGDGSWNKGDAEKKVDVQLAEEE